MPGLITHYLIGKDTLGYIYNDNIKQTINTHRDVYNLGLQGPDFFFYDLNHCSKFKGFNYGRLLHTNNTSMFFYHFLKGIAILPEKSNPVAISYFYGLLCHVSLDVTAHPYILYMSCFKTDNEKERRLSSLSHTFFETEIDKEMLLIKRGMSPNMLRRQDLAYAKEDDLRLISKVFSYAFNKTFHQYTTGKQIYSSYRHFHLTNIILQDDNHVKIAIMQQFEKTALRHSLITGLLYSKTARISWDVLNRMHARWCLPWNNLKSSTKSFIDLYDDAALLASKLINDADSIINWDIKPDDFLKMIGNRSYITGEDCDRQVTMKYFRSSSKNIVR